MTTLDLSMFQHLVDRKVQPFQFEPLAANQSNVPSTVTTALSEDLLVRSGRKNSAVRQWCTCGKCNPMDTDLECLCCNELSEAKDYLSGDTGCVTDHTFFKECCLSRWTLHICYGYQQKICPSSIGTEFSNNRYRHTAYRNFVWALWEKLYKKDRKVIPACAVLQIRAAFPDDLEKYTGFQVVPTE